MDYLTASGLGYDQHGRSAGIGTAFSNSLYLGRYTPLSTIAYDEDFKTATRSPSDVFFGGAESLWVESSTAFFDQINF